MMQAAGSKIAGKLDRAVRYYLKRLDTGEMVHDKLIDNGWSRI